MSEAIGTPERDIWARRLGFAGLAVDLAMVALAIFSLLLIIVDSIWVVPELRALLAVVIPESWLAAYAPVHEHFFRIDMVIVSIFLTEFILRWAISVYSGQHARWYAYPILHWYDLLGCIPTAGLRWLRVLRVFSMLIRLQNMGLIDCTKWPPVRWAKGIYDIFMEEVSDRVVLRVLSGMQDEVASHGALEKQMLERIVLPRQEAITLALRERIVHVSRHTYAGAREDIHHYVRKVVSRAVRENREIRTIDRIPLVGGVASDLLDHAITDIVCRVIDELSETMSSADFEQLFADLFDGLLEALGATSAAESDQLSRAIIDVIEVVKEQVAERRWLQPAS